MGERSPRPRLDDDRQEVSVSTRIDPLFDPAVVEDPHDYYAQLRALDPVHELAGTRTFLVTRMALIHEVVAKPAVFSSVNGEFLHVGDRETACLRGVGPVGADARVGAVLATADPPAHTR